MMNTVATTLDHTQIESIRSQFPILDQELKGYPLVYLDNGASTQKPNVVVSSISEYYNTINSNVHRGVHQLSQIATDAFEASREAILKYINAGSIEEVIFTKGTTESINLVASSFGGTFLKEGDEIIITTMEHHSNIVPWQMICEQVGAVLKVVPMNDEGETIFSELEALISDKTALISVVHVSNALGTINPVKQIIDLAHSKDIPVLVDAAQSIQHLNVDVQSLDCDFLAFSSHKMYGPMGMGILYGKKKWLAAMKPYHGGGEMIKTVTFEKTTYNELPFKFEAGTPNVSGAIGMAKAVDFINGIGREAIHEYEDRLLKYATDEIKKVPGIRLIGTATEKSSVLSFLLDGTHPYDVGMLLDQQGVAVRTGHHCTEPLMDRLGIPGTVRASFAIYNNEQDVNRFIQALTKAQQMLS